MRARLTFLTVALLAASFRAAPAHADSPCAARTFEGERFNVCAVDLNAADVRFFLKKPDGTNYSHLEELPRERLLFATNAGMFRPDYLPAGLHVENGRERAALNTRQGGGNFHVQPNGVFWIKNGEATISTTEDYQRQSPEPDGATQSGPMLVIAGALNSKFVANGPSRYVRNGVGIVDPTHIFLAISQGPVSFGVFARLFRDELKCTNALYLDGSLARLYVPEAGEARGLPLGPMIGVYARAPD